MGTFLERWLRPQSIAILLAGVGPFVGLVLGGWNYLETMLVIWLELYLAVLYSIARYILLRSDDGKPLKDPGTALFATTFLSTCMFYILGMVLVMTLHKAEHGLTDFVPPAWPALAVPVIVANPWLLIWPGIWLLQGVWTLFRDHRNKVRFSTREAARGFGYCVTALVGFAGAALVVDKRGSFIVAIAPLLVLKTVLEMAVFATRPEPKEYVPIGMRKRAPEPEAE